MPKYTVNVVMDTALTPNEIELMILNLPDVETVSIARMPARRHYVVPAEVVGTRIRNPLYYTTDLQQALSYVQAHEDEYSYGLAIVDESGTLAELET
jgi:hypothetical protein